MTFPPPVPHKPKVSLKHIHPLSSPRCPQLSALEASGGDKRTTDHYIQTRDYVCQAMDKLMQQLNRAKDQLVRPQKTTVADATSDPTNQSVCCVPEKSALGSGPLHIFRSFFCAARALVRIASFGPPALAPPPQPRADTHTQPYSFPGLSLTHLRPPKRDMPRKIALFLHWRPSTHAHARMYL